MKCSLDSVEHKLGQQQTLVDAGYMTLTWRVTPQVRGDTNSVCLQQCWINDVQIRLNTGEVQAIVTGLKFCNA